MTEKNDADVIDNAEKPLPAFVKAAPELLPLWDWWVQNGKSTIMTLVVVAVAVLGFYGVRGYLNGRNAKASRALSVSNASEELSGAVAEYGSSSIGAGLKLRLAKSHYDNDQFQDALDVYEAIIKDAGKDDPFLDIAVLGKAFALEGLKKYQEAQEVFSTYASDESKSHDGYRTTAQFGVARCKALQQKNAAEAVEYLTGLKDATTDEDKKTRIDSMLALLKHYDFSHEDATLSDAFSLPEALPTPGSNAAIPAPAAQPAVPAPAPAAAKPATPAPAAAPAAAKPATPAPAPAPAAAKPATPAPAPAPAAAKPATPAPAATAKP